MWGTPWYIRYLINCPKRTNKKSKYANKKENNNNKNSVTNILNNNFSDKIINNDNNKVSNRPPNCNERGIYLHINNKYYINMELYPIIRNFNNINPLNVEIKSIIGDGNCLFRAIPHFI